MERPTFGTWLKQRRLESGLTQDQLAERIGRGRTYVVRLENGYIRLPQEPVRKAIHEVLGTSERELIEFGIVQPLRRPNWMESANHDHEQIHRSIESGNVDDDAPLTPDEEALLSRVFFTGLSELTPRKLREVIRIIQETE